MHYQIIVFALLYAAGLTIVIYVHFMTDIKGRLKKKREAIENGLLNFIRSILYKVGNDEKNRYKS